MVDSIVSHKCNCIEGDPLPEGNIIGHGVCLHLALHLNVEDLKGFGGWRGGGSIYTSTYTCISVGQIINLITIRFVLGYT